MLTAISQRSLSFPTAAALTRAKSLIVVIGPERAIDKAVKEAEGDKRLSTLKDRIQVRDISAVVLSLCDLLDAKSRPTCLGNFMSLQGTN